ncbi:hypothetical protein C7M84_007315 [Penaeus vannamei]|uniref:Uncharacterized protein n=1 Tax=Penaeus vannamei TaxID=6689 RepID=A0A3R7PQU0_PENVA|nr:hypothetical protein C7M84_007315 [Penaeus vannamei]
MGRGGRREEGWRGRSQSIWPFLLPDSRPCVPQRGLSGATDNARLLVKPHLCSFRTQASNHFYSPLLQNFPSPTSLLPYPFPISLKHHPPHFPYSPTPPLTPPRPLPSTTPSYTPEIFRPFTPRIFLHYSPTIPKMLSPPSPPTSYDLTQVTLPTPTIGQVPLPLPTLSSPHLQPPTTHPPQVLPLTPHHLLNSFSPPPPHPPQTHLPFLTTLTPPLTTSPPIPQPPLIRQPLPFPNTPTSSTPRHNPPHPTPSPPPLHPSPPPLPAIPNFLLRSPCSYQRGGMLSENVLATGRKNVNTQAADTLRAVRPLMFPLDPSSLSYTFTEMFPFPSHSIHSQIPHSRSLTLKGTAPFLPSHLYSMQLVPFSLTVTSKTSPLFTHACTQRHPSPFSLTPTLR